MRSPVVLMLGLPLLAQTVHTVDITGASGFTTIQAAIDAAQDGDVICVRSGNYTNGSFVVNDKALTIVEETGHLVTAVSAVVHNPNGKAVVIKGIGFRRNSAAVNGPNPGRNLLITDNTGHVWLEDCSFRTEGVIIVAAGPALPAIEIASTVASGGAVVLSRCEVRGSNGVRMPTGSMMQAGIGLYATTAANDRVALFETTVAGGDGANGFWTTGVSGGSGAHGIAMQHGALLLSGGTLAGGRGGSGSAGTTCVAGGNGGDALRLVGNAAVSTIGGQTAMAGGAAGAAAGACGAGMAGAAANTGAGSLTAVPGHRAWASAPATTGPGPLAVAFGGAPLGFAFVAATLLGPDHLSFPFASGPLLLSLPGLVTLPLISFDGSGLHTASYAVAVGPPAGQAFVLRFQLAAVDAAGAFAFGAPTVVVVK